MFIGIELQRRKDENGRGWYRIAPAIIKQDGDDEREARVFRGTTAGTLAAALLIITLIILSSRVPDPVTHPTVALSGVIAR